MQVSLILFFLTYAVVSLKMNQRSCDRSGEAAEAFLESGLYKGNMCNKTACVRIQNSIDLVETYGEMQSEYTEFLAKDGTVCIDNLGFYDEELRLPDVVESSTARGNKCVTPLTDRYGQNMYKFMVTDGLPKDALKNKQVLEVGCGRGKGAAYVAQTFGPANYVGIDLNKDRVGLASKFWGETPNLHFKVGSALELPIEDSSMDFVLNVESSFHYPNFNKFLSEVYRALKPGGKFLWTSPLLNRGDTVASKQDQFTAVGFHLVKNTDITQHVVKSRKYALEKSGAQEFEKLCSWLDTPSGALWEIWFMPGSHGYKMMEKGEIPYIRLIAEKPL